MVKDVIFIFNIIIQHVEGKMYKIINFTYAGEEVRNI